VFESSVLRKIFVLKREEITGGLIKLHTEEHYLSYQINNSDRDMACNKRGIDVHTKFLREI
jgi:hypothetical protein